MGMLKEYKEFISKGNVIDLAVGVVIGGAFGKIVSSLVNDIVMPPIGYLLKGINFKDLKVVLTRAGTDAAGVAIPKSLLPTEVLFRLPLNSSSLPG